MPDESPEAVASTAYTNIRTCFLSRKTCRLSEPAACALDALSPLLETVPGLGQAPLTADQQQQTKHVGGHFLEDEVPAALGGGAVSRTALCRGTACGCQQCNLRGTPKAPPLPKYLLHHHAKTRSSLPICLETSGRFWLGNRV